MKTNRNMGEFPQQIACAMCGNVFDPQEAAAQHHCQACPLHANCGLARCPRCGFETINPKQSYLARLAARLLPPREVDKNPLSHKR